MARFASLSFAALLCATLLCAQTPILIKVVVVTMFERGDDLADIPGEFQLWAEREHLDQVLPLASGYHPLRLNKDGVLGMVTGVGTAKAAAAVMAVGLDPRFDLSKAYWLVAGIGGGDPADVSLGSAIWADHVIDGDLAYEIDARDIPKDWTTGFVPLRKAKPYEDPVRRELEGEIYTLNPALVDWAYALTKSVPLADTAAIRTARERFTGFDSARKPPFVAKGSTISSGTFWHGTRLDAWANDWTRYFTGGKGNYMISAMEDTGTMQSLTLLAQSKRVDLNRVLVLRTVSNFDREAPGGTPAESLSGLVTGAYSAYMPALEAAHAVGSTVVHNILENWQKLANETPR